MSTIPGYWFGASPPEGAQAAYGCRAILDGRGSKQCIDIVHDRQQITPDPPKEFHKWIDATLMRWLNPSSPRQRKPKIGYVDPSDDEVHVLNDGKFHAKACAKRSHGYLYVAAWMDAEPPKEKTI